MYDAGNAERVLCDNWPKDGSGLWEGGDPCLPMTDSHRCMAEAITIL